MVLSDNWFGDTGGDYVYLDVVFATLLIFSDVENFENVEIFRNSKHDGSWGVISSGNKQCASKVTMRLIKLLLIC